MDVTQKTVEVEVEKTLVVKEEREEFVLRLSKQEFADLRSHLFAASGTGHCGKNVQAEESAWLMYQELARLCDTHEQEPSWRMEEPF